MIFDKSFLESLSPDEAVWLDMYFTTFITPLFFVETLADLEKQMRGGRTPEQIVGQGSRTKRYFHSIHEAAPFHGSNC